MMFFFQAEHPKNGKEAQLQLWCEKVIASDCPLIFATIFLLLLEQSISQILHYVPYANSAFRSTSIMTHQLKS